MKIKSVFKKLKKKKSGYDGVLKDDTQTSTYTVESAEMGTSKPKMQTTKKVKSASNIGSSQQQTVQKASADPSSHENLRKKVVGINRIRSDVQQKNERKELKEPARPLTQKRPVPASRPSAQAPTKDLNKPAGDFQDDFGMEQNRFLQSDGAWASFGDSRGFFNSSARRSGSIFTESTANESGSGSSLSSPSNSSFESTGSQDNSSSDQVVAASPRPPSSEESARPVSSSVVNVITPEKQQKPLAASPPKPERRTDTSLPMSQSLQVGQQDQRQRASPPLPTANNKRNPSPTVSSYNKSSSLPSSSSQESVSVSTKSTPPAPVYKSVQPLPSRRRNIVEKLPTRATPPPPVSTKPAVQPLSTKRRSITDRYTAALGSSPSVESSSSRTPSPMNYHHRTSVGSKKSVLDNHPLYGKRSTVEKKEDVPAKQQQERTEPPQVKSVTPSTSSSKITTSQKRSSDPQAKSVPWPSSSAPQVVKSAAVPYPPLPPFKPTTRRSPVEIFEEKKEEEEPAAIPPVVPTKKDEDVVPDSIEVPSKDGSNNEDQQEKEEPVAVVNNNNLIGATIQVSENVLAMEEEPTMEPQQQQQQQDLVVEDYSSPTNEEEEETTPEESQLDTSENSMPILSTSPEFDAIPPQHQQQKIINSMESKEENDDDDDDDDISESSSDDESQSVPIGEVSFDSGSEGSHTNQEEEGDETLGETDAEEYTYDPDGVSMLSEDYTFESGYTHELSKGKGKSDRFSSWVENTIFGMANFMCPMGEEETVYDA